MDRLADELRQFTGLPWRRYLQNGVYPILTLATATAPGQPGRGQPRQVDRAGPPLRPADVRLQAPRRLLRPAWEGLAPPGGEWPEETTVKSAGPYRPAPHEDCLLYDLTVADAGTFVVHGMLVGDATSHVDAGRPAPPEGDDGPGFTLFD